MEVLDRLVGFVESKISEKGDKLSLLRELGGDNGKGKHTDRDILSLLVDKTRHKPDKLTSTCSNAKKFNDSAL